MSSSLPSQCAPKSLSLPEHTTVLVHFLGCIKCSTEDWILITKLSSSFIVITEQRPTSESLAISENTVYDLPLNAT